MANVVTAIAAAAKSVTVTARTLIKMRETTMRPTRMPKANPKPTTFDAVFASRFTAGDTRYVFSQFHTPTSHETYKNRNSESSSSVGRPSSENASESLNADAPEGAGIFVTR